MGVLFPTASVGVSIFNIDVLVYDTRDILTSRHSIKRVHDVHVWYIHEQGNMLGYILSDYECCCWTHAGRLLVLNI